MHSVLWIDIDQPVHAEEVSLGILLEFVKNVSYVFFSTESLSSILFCLLAGCKSDDECPLTEACYDRECRDPCLFQDCGTHAVCTARLHQAFCQCKEGYRGNPYDQCRQYECLIDSDCRDTLKCENEKCVDPCACAQFADCTPRNHRGICTCFPDYTGNPYGIVCNPSKKSIQWFLKHSLKLIFAFTSPRASCSGPRMHYWWWLSKQASLFQWRLLKSMSAYTAMCSKCWVWSEKWASSSCNGVHLQTWLHWQGRWEMWAYK